MTATSTISLDLIDYWILKTEENQNEAAKYAQHWSTTAGRTAVNLGLESPQSLAAVEVRNLFTRCSFCFEISNSRCSAVKRGEDELLSAQQEADRGSEFWAKAQEAARSYEKIGVNS